MGGLLDPEAWKEAGRRAKGLLAEKLEEAKGILGHAKAVSEGKGDPYDISKALGMAGFAMGGGIGGAPAGAIGAGPFRPRTFYRGENPGDTRRIKTGDDQWDSHLFGADNIDDAKMYGSQITKLEAAPDAKLLYEGTKEFQQVAGRMRKGENLLEYSSRVAKAAKEAGYDAVWFKRQGDVGTAIINPDKFKRGLPDDDVTLGSGPSDPKGAGLLGGGLMSGETPSIRAYHGSPHDFDRFSLDKIGTGEGAQAYGHGLYFAENEGVARSYRDALKWKGSNWDNPEFVASYWVKHYGNKEDAIKYLEGVQRAKAKTSPQPEVDGALDILRKGDFEAFDSPNPGRMYEVEIKADPDRFLDWDKPLSEHPREVREALAKTVWADQGATADDLLDVGLPGEHAYKMMIAQRGGSVLPGASRTPQASGATEALREAGIPGIKYLDAGSRTAGDGSRNYVVFDDSLVEIVKKYGIAGLAMLPPAVLIANGIDPASLQGEQ